MHLPPRLCQALLGPLLQGAPTQCVQNATQTPAVCLLGAAQQRDPPGPKAPRGPPGPVFRCLATARGVGLQVPSSFPTIWPRCSRVRAWSKTLGERKVMVSALSTQNRGEGPGEGFSQWDPEKGRRNTGILGGGGRETRSCRETPGRVVPHPCLRCQQMAGLCFFKEVKAHQTPPSFQQWLGQLLWGGLCGSGHGDPIP